MDEEDELSLEELKHIIYLVRLRLRYEGRRPEYWKDGVDKHAILLLWQRDLLEKLERRAVQLAREEG